MAVVRTTISVPAEVKGRMDRADGINWSAVATKAFEEILLVLESQMDAGTVEQAVRRLRAAARLEENEANQAGVTAGREWAMKRATPRQLRRLAEPVEHLDPTVERGWAEFLAHCEEHGEGTAAGLLNVLEPPRAAAEWDDPDAYWRAALREEDAERIGEREFAHGFVVAALAFWQSVEDRVK